jgi:transposase
LLRELIGVREQTGQEWAGKMTGLLLEMKMVVGKYRGRILRRGKKRGKAKQNNAWLLLERLEGYKEEYLRFSRDFRVPFDNNQAERDCGLSVRWIAKVKQKVSGCFRSDSGAEAFAVIASFIQTIHKHHESIGEELVKVIQGPYSFPFDLMATE